MSRDNIRHAEFNLDAFPESDTRLSEQAHFLALARLEGELLEIGRVGGRAYRAAGVTQADAAWSVALPFDREGGRVRELVRLGVAEAYANDPDEFVFE